MRHPVVRRQQQAQALYFYQQTYVKCENFLKLRSCIKKKILLDLKLEFLGADLRIFPKPMYSFINYRTVSHTVFPRINSADTILFLIFKTLKISYTVFPHIVAAATILF